MNRHIICSLALLFAFSTAVIAKDQAAPKRTAVRSFEEMNWLNQLGPTEGKIRLGYPVDGIGAAGEMANMQVDASMVLDGKFRQEVNTYVNGTERHEHIRSVWGINPATNTMYRWAYMSNGWVMHGPVMAEGNDTLVHVIDGATTPTEGPMLQLAKALQTPELKYHVEITFKKTPAGMTATISKVQINGSPMPWPGLGEAAEFRPRQR